MLVGLSEIFSLFHHRMGQISVTLNRCKYNNHNLLDYKRATADDGWWFLFFLFLWQWWINFAMKWIAFPLRFSDAFPSKPSPQKCKIDRFTFVFDCCAKQISALCYFLSRSFPIILHVFIVILNFVGFICNRFGGWKMKNEKWKIKRRSQ